MPTISVVTECSDEELATLRTPRNDIVGEVADLDTKDRWTLEHGPFTRYERRLQTQPVGEGRHRVTETMTYALSIPVWGWVMAWPIRRALRKRQTEFRYWWAPPDRLSAHATAVLSLLCVIQIVDGYLGTVLTQTLSFAVDEFGQSNTAQGIVFGVVRFGVLITLVISTLADRRGRRPLILFAGISSCLMTVAGGLSPNLVVLGGTQLIARGLSTALGILLAIVAVEEMPTRSRAWAASVLTVTAGLGSGMAVWVLPLADLDVQGWRSIYLLAAVGVAVVWWATRRLPETKRFAAHQDETADPILGAEALATRRQRFILLGVSLFLLAFFAAPASGFQNEFLRDERGFSGADITLFTIFTATPIGLGVLVGGSLSESWGRRPVAALGLTLGTIGVALAFMVSGPLMWGVRLVANIVAAAAVPAMAVYGPELFATRDRGRANAVIVTVGVAGSAAGLLLVGYLSSRWDGVASPIALTALGPLAVAALVLVWFPETAGKDLEELNPQDADAVVE